ncbi:hypothetical protein EXIGLDRAFT_718311 [Exidia glandulosa HHB12029]|uniref:F-box domain-containing protein n=1 Tax=Exidia glandulosa HHB12029 TaxID=1314781 RepID=A0A165HSZ8_EXIGL|nr:hypothetical protein EXIGLDRAFT_718311 [Exidia glandulosa HHB12029]
MDAIRRKDDLPTAVTDAAVIVECAPVQDARSSISRQRLLDDALREPAVHHSPLNPTRRTPLEVLGLIFEFCVDVDLSQTPTPEFAKLCRAQPFLLASVCITWRRAALACPRVWSNIDFDISKVNMHGVASQCNYFSNVFSRAGRSTVNLRFACRRRVLDHDTPLMKLLLVELQRCDTLVISIERMENHHATLSVFLADFPKLRYLHLDVSALDLAVDRTRLFPHTPLLRSIAGRFIFEGTKLCLPNLVSASLDFANAAGACAVLQSARSIQNLNLHIRGKHPENELLTPRKYPSVKTLAIRYHHHSSAPIVDLARYSRFTGLNRLDLCGGRVGTLARMTFLSLAAVHMGSSLTRLCLEIGEDSAHVLELLFSSLSLCPKMTHLTFTAHFGRLDICRLCEYLATPSATGTWPCPNLEELDLVECVFNSSRDPAFIVSFIGRRMAAALDEKVVPSSRPKPLLRVLPPTTASAELRADILALLSARTLDELCM